MKPRLIISIILLSTIIVFLSGCVQQIPSTPFDTIPPYSYIVNEETNQSCTKLGFCVDDHVEFNDKFIQGFGYKDIGLGIITKVNYSTGEVVILKETLNNNGGETTIITHEIYLKK